MILFAMGGMQYWLKRITLNNIKITLHKSLVSLYSRDIHNSWWIYFQAKAQPREQSPATESGYHLDKQIVTRLTVGRVKP